MRPVRGLVGGEPMSKRLVCPAAACLFWLFGDSRRRARTPIGPGLHPARRPEPAAAGLQRNHRSRTARPRGPMSTAAGRCWTRASSTGRSQTPPRPSRSTPAWPRPTPTGPPRSSARARTIAPSPTQRKPLRSTRRLAIAYANRAHGYINKADFDRAIADYDDRPQDRSEAAHGLQRARLGLSQQGRDRSRHRRLRPGHPTRARSS